MQASFEEAINQLIARHPEYAAEAYYFMRNAIDYAAEQLNKSDQSPHLSAEELYLGACAYALDEYGPLARHLLASWNLRSSHDFGCIVYNLIEAGIFGRQNSDRQDEFEHLPPLCDILESPYSIMPIPPQTPEDEAEPAPPAPRKKAAKTRSRRRQTPPSDGTASADNSSDDSSPDSSPDTESPDNTSPAA